MITNKLCITMKHLSQNIVIADTQYLVIETLKKILEAEQQLTLTGIVGSRAELDRLLNEVKCDLLITDHALMDFASVEELQHLRIRHPELKVLVLTNSLSKQELTELTKIGIKNILLKTTDKNELLTAIEAALKGKKYFAEEILDRLIELSENRSIPDEQSRLTASEIEIVRLIAGGMSTKEIADIRCISYHTVNTHRKNIFRKLEVTNSSELIMHAIKAGWIDNIEYFI